MSDEGKWDPVKAVIVPLAEQMEEFSRTAYPASSFNSLKFDRALLRLEYEKCRRLLEFDISPAYARVFQRTIMGPIIRLRRLERMVMRKPPETWSQEFIDEYNEIWEEVDRSADWLRQLAWMIVAKRAHKKEALEAKRNAPVSYANELTPLDQPPVMRRKKMGEKTLAIIDDCIKRGKTPMQCLLRELKNIAHDRWLDDLRDAFPDICNYGDIANRDNPAHVDAFDRFKKVYYRRRNALKAQGLLKTKE